MSRVMNHESSHYPFLICNKLYNNGFIMGVSVSFFLQLLDFYCQVTYVPIPQVGKFTNA
jgi:hypothetical protein